MSAAERPPFRVLGFGSPIVDLTARVSEDFLRREVSGGKGGMEPVAARELDLLAAKLPAPPVLCAGGAAANTVFALLRTGAEASFFGRVGDDGAGEFFLRRWREAGGDDTRFVIVPGRATARCLVLVTPDAERTMRSDLGVSLEFSDAEIAAVDFSRFDLFYVEGFMAFAPRCRKAIAAARSAGCRVALDLASFEVVKRFHPFFSGLLRDGMIDFLFANRAEAEALTGESDPAAALRRISATAEFASVKLGAEGALVAGPEGIRRVAARKVSDPVDTTGAGDLWAAGFLAGWSRGESPERSGAYGALFAGEVVRSRGADMDEAAWRRIAAGIEELSAGKNTTATGRE